MFQLEELVQKSVHLAYRRQRSATLAVGAPDTSQQSQLTLDGVSIPRVLFVSADHQSILSPNQGALSR